MKNNQSRRDSNRKFWGRTTVLGVIVAALMTVLASPAYAATGVSKNGDQLIVTAAAGRANDLSIRRSPDGQFILINDRGDSITPGSGCQAAGTEVQCSRSGVTRVVVNAGDGNDRITVSDIPSTVNAGTGDDRLVAGSFGDSLRGGAGNDLLIGSRFTDFLQGGAGNDDLRGGDGNDSLRGDAGNDRLDGGPGIDDLCIGETEINCEADV